MKTLTKILIVLALLGVLVFSVSVLRLPGLVKRSAPIDEARSQVVSRAPYLAIFNEGRPSLQAGGLTVGQISIPLQGGPGDELVLGGAYVLREGEVLEGSLFVLGGTATLETGSLVEGDVMLLGGSVIVDGTVEGAIIAIGGFADLGENALIKGDVNAIGGHVTYENRESIEGDLNTGLPGGEINIPGIPPIPTIPDVPDLEMRSNFAGRWVGSVMSFVWGVISWLFWAFVMALLAVLAVLFIPRNVERTSEVVASQPVITGGLGLLTIVVAPLLLVVIAITIIGIPISFLALFILVVAWGFGLIAIGTEIGKRFASAMNQDWALPVSAAVGTLVLILVINGIGQLVPCIGWMVPALVGMVGLGAVLLTLFGSRDYPVTPVVGAPTAPDSPPAPAPLQAPTLPTTVVDVPDEELQDEGVDAAPFEKEAVEAQVESPEGIENDVPATDSGDESIPDPLG